jgi:Uma2 family endonuclease
MSVATRLPESVAAPLFERLYRLSVDQYHRMAEAGILGEDDPVELLEGLLVTKMTKNPPHIIATELLQQALTRVVPAGYFCSMQNPISMPDDDSEPEPDAKVVRGHPRDYRGRKPGPADVVLVIEVSDTSYPDDLRKRVVYARAGIPAYWIIDLNASRLEVYSAPTGPGPGPGGSASYSKAETFGPDDEVPLVLHDREVARLLVRDVLP